MIYVSGAMMVLGFVFILAGIAGVLRFPDFFTRLHALGKCDTVGIGLVLGGLALYQGVNLTTMKILLILVLVALANPTATHALGRSALKAGMKPWAKGDAAK